jgi:hypothetical protein
LNRPATCGRGCGRTSAIRSSRQGQEEIVAAVLGGRDVLAVMPTGSGKSLGYQLPAVMLPGTTLVVSPLVSLMKVQVDELNRRGIGSASLHSMLSVDNRREVLTRTVRAVGHRHLVRTTKITKGTFSLPLKNSYLCVLCVLCVEYKPRIMSARAAVLRLWPDDAVRVPPDASVSRLH